MLHNVDKTNADRAIPSVNTHDLPNVLRQAHGTNSVNYVTPSSALSSLTAGKNGQFTIVQTGLSAPANSFFTTNPGAGNYVADQTTLTTQAHNLGFTPAVVGYIVSGGSYFQLPFTSYNTASTTQAIWWNILLSVDSVNVYTSIITMSYGINWQVGLAPIKWYLLQQTSN